MDDEEKWRKLETSAGQNIEGKTERQRERERIEESLSLINV
jgi:hypothetical protein